MKKADYLKGLKDAERVEAEVQQTDPTPAAPAPAAPVEAATPATPAPATPATPAEPELFPGFNALPEERRKEIADRWKLAEEAQAAKDEAKRAAHELYLAQSRVGPTQQQLSKAQLEITKLSQQLSEAKGKQQTGEASELKKRIEAIRENFPDDAAVFEGTLLQAEQARQAALDTRKEIDKLRQESFVARQLSELSAAHPDWQKKRIGVYTAEDGTKSFKKTADTPESAEMEVWANALDPYDREIVERCILSMNARDTIYALNRFEQDRAVAKVLAAQGQPAAPAAPVVPTTPAPDPDPSTRITAPSTKTAGQPMSEKQRELKAAADWLRQQGKLPPTARRA